MFNDFLDFVKRIGIFLICAESILYFSPGSSYQKYIRVLIGLMVLIQFVIPVRALLSGQGLEPIEAQINEFRLQMEKTASESSIEFLEAPNHEKIVENRLAEEVKSRLNNVLIAEKKDFVVRNVEIGKITRVTISSHKWKDNDDNPIRIDDIKIDRIRFNDKTGREEDEIKEKILELFAKELGTETEYLEVVIID